MSSPYGESADSASAICFECSVRVVAQGPTRFAARRPTGYDSSSRIRNWTAAMGVVGATVLFLGTVLGDRAAIAAVNLAPRRQLAVLLVSVKRRRLRMRDRIFRFW
jgi:hypothetical protein